MPTKFATTDFEKLEAAVRQARFGGLLQVKDALRPLPGSRILTIVMSIAAVLVATAVQLLLMNWVPGGDSLYLVLIMAILFSAAVGGLLEGTMATVICLVISLSLADAGRGFSYATLINSIVFAAIGLGLSMLGEFFHRIKHRVALTTEHLRGRESHLRSILETIPDAMIITDETGTIRSFSGAAERLFGYSADEARGKPMGMLMPARSSDGSDGTLDTTGRVGVGERKDRSTFPLELVTGEMQSGDRRYITVFVRDLTERHKTEARLQELQSGMAHYSRLTAMGEMASALAHELNQPLSSIANYLRGLQRTEESAEPLDPAARKAVIEKTVEQAMRAGQIISRLRSFVARGETDQRAESLSKLVEEASALALVGFRESGIHLRYEFDPRADLVLADRVQIQQVVLNLVRNALEAVAGGDNRTMLIATEATSGEFMTVKVCDNGRGISPDVASRLFQPFVTTKRTGMGVGLSISRTIVESHGGRIWYEPGSEGGSAFCFTIPRMMEDEIEDAA